MKCKTVPSVCIYGYVDSFTRKVVVLPSQVFLIQFMLGTPSKDQTGNPTPQLRKNQDTLIKDSLRRKRFCAV